MVKLRYISDIHLEFLKKFPKFKCDDYDNETLLLLGDIGHLNSKNYIDFIEYCSKNFKNVVLVYGNHEYYGTDKDLPIEEVINIDYPVNVHTLNNDVIYLNKITNTIETHIKENCIKLIGTTLWSNVTNHMSYLLNDYNYIYTNDGGSKLSVFKVREMFEVNKKFILNEINEMKCIVLTHHGTHEICNGQYAGSNTSSGYYTHIPEIYENKNVIACINGHLHTNVNTEINGIKILSNCVGYKNESVKFNKDAILEVI